MEKPAGNVPLPIVEKPAVTRQANGLLSFKAFLRLNGGLSPPQPNVRAD